MIEVCRAHTQVYSLLQGLSLKTTKTGSEVCKFKVYSLFQCLGLRTTKTGSEVCKSHTHAYSLFQCFEVCSFDMKVYSLFQCLGLRTTKTGSEVLFTLSFTACFNA